VLAGGDDLFPHAVDDNRKVVLEIERIGRHLSTMRLAPTR
jgi:hypothetical protein